MIFNLLASLRLRRCLDFVNHYLVAKYTPIDEDGKFGASVYAMSDKYVKDSAPEEKKKARGKNMNKKVASLKPGEKLKIEFFNNRGVDVNQEAWSRHLGRIVRDVNICLVQFHTWKDVTKEVKNHLWVAVKDCFENVNIEIYREETLTHMGSLWTSWRSDLRCRFVKPCKTKAEALKNCPKGINVRDWTWLVNEKWSFTKFLQMSKQNTENRAKDVLPHHTGSKPHRAIMYEMGGKDGNPPDFPSLFFATQQKNGQLQDKAAANKYDEIVKTTQADPSLSTIEVIDQCFGKQTHNCVFVYGGGIKRKTLSGSKTTYEKELEAQLLQKEEENQYLKRRFDKIDSRLDHMESGNVHSSAVASPTTSIDLNEAN